VSAAPDYVEPIVGWRTWLVVQEGEGFRLRSVVYDALWSLRTELVARCLHRALPVPRRRRSKHVPPVAAAAAASTRRVSPPRPRPISRDAPGAETLSVHRVIGTVSLWGRVVECTRGWRASRAYPKAIYVPAMRAPYWLRAERAEEVALALTAYDVPVELLDADSCGPKEVVAALGGGAARD
jgi:hypothetical protein